MRDISSVVMFTIFCFTLIFISTKYSMENYKQDTVVMNVNETLRATVIANRDDSARLKEGTFKIDKENFEKDFEKRLATSDQVSTEDGSLVFDYLETGEGNIKAVKVKIKGESNSYQATTILDTASD